MPDVTTTLLAMYQQIIGGSNAREQSSLEAEAARRVILAGININPAGIVSFPNNVAFGGITVVNATVTGSLTVTGTFSVPGTLTVGTLAVTGAATVGGLLTASAGLLVSGNATMDSLSVNGSGTFTAATAGSLAVTIQNTNAANGSEGTLNVGNNISNTLFQIRSLSSGTTPSGFFQPGATLLTQIGSGGLTLSSTTGALKLVTAGLERLRIATSGEVLVNATANPSIGRLLIVTDLQTSQACVLQNSNAANAGNFMLFNNSAGASAGNISQTGATSIVYGAASDARLKDDAGRATDLAALRAVVIHDFTWKADGVAARGVFAQEVAPLFPQAVLAGRDDRTERGDLQYPWMTDYSKFVPDLIVGWQQHDAELVALRALLAGIQG